VIFSLAAVPNASTRGDPSIHFQCYFSHGPLTFLILHVCVHIASVKNLASFWWSQKRKKSKLFCQKWPNNTRGIRRFPLPVIPWYASTLHLFVQIRADLFLKISWTDLRAGLTCAIHKPHTTRGNMQQSSGRERDASDPIFHLSLL